MWLGYIDGVAAREMGELEPSEWPLADFCDVRRWPRAPGGGVPFCDRVWSRILGSKRLCGGGKRSVRALTITDYGGHARRRAGDKHTFFFAFWAAPELLTRLRLLITSVLRLIGRGRPWSLRKRPQALQRTEPISSRRHKGVVEVVQF